MGDPDAFKSFALKSLSGTSSAAFPTARAANESASSNIAEVGERSMLEALPYADRSEEVAFRQRLRGVKDPQVRSQVQSTAEPALKKMREVRAKASAAIFSAKARGDEETAAAIRDALKEAQTQAEPRGGPVQTAKQGGRLLLKAIDAPHHLVRQATTKIFGDSSHGLYDRDISSAEWTENVRKTAEAGGVKGAIAQAATAVPRLVGYPAGAAVGASIAGLGAITDVPGLVRGERTGKDMLHNAVQTVKDTARDTADLALTIETDPLSYVSLGVGGSSKSAASATLRTALKEGIPEVAARALAEDVGRVAATSGGAPKAFDGAIAAFEKALGPQKGPELARKIFGAEGEFFGRGQLEVHAPFASHKGVAVAPALGGDEFALGKAFKRALDPVITKAGGRPLFHPRAIELEGAQRGARALQETLAREDIESFKADLAKLPEGHKIDAAAREAILNRHFDPKTVEEYVPRENPEYRTLPFEERKARFGKEQFDPTSGASLGTTVDIPADNLDRVFGPGATAYADAVRNFFKRSEKALTSSGVLEKTASNPFSGEYVPRFYKSVVQPLEQTIEQTSIRRAGSPILNERKLATPTDDLPYAKRETDITKIVPQYARLSARARAQKSLEEALVGAYGVEPGKGAGSGLKTTMVHLADYGKEVPADVANIMRGTFELGLSTMGRALRRAGLESSAAGRALLQVLDAHHGIAQRFKSLVLKTPAYHVVNIVDDTAKMIASGMKNVLGYLTKARKLMAGQAVDAGGIQRSLAEANQQKIGLGAAARYERQGGEAQGRAIERTIAEASGKRGALAKAGDMAHGVNDFSNRFGEEWENTAKVANWLWRLDMGDSPIIAAHRTMETLIDYSNKSKAEQVLGWAVPFIRYAWASPKVAGTLAARNPGALNAIDRGLELFGSRERENEPPRYITERGAYAQGTDRQKEIFGNLRQLFGGAGAKEGLSYGFVPRLVQYDALAPILELAEGNPDALMLQMGPMIKAGIELGQEQDLLTKQPLRRPDSFFDWFPAETPFIPPLLKASSGENPWLSRYLPPFLASPGVNLAANTALNQVQGGQGPAAYLGGSRPYTGRKDPTDTIAQAWMKYFLGQPGYETTPADRPVSLAGMPEVLNALADQQAAKKTAKAERKNRKR